MGWLEPCMLAGPNCSAARFPHTSQSYIDSLRLANTLAATKPASACILSAPPPTAMHLTLISATGRRKERLELEQAQLTEAALRAAVVRQLALAPPAAAQLRLVHKGQALADDESVSRLKDGGERRVVGQAAACQTVGALRLSAACARPTPACVALFLLHSGSRPSLPHAQPVALHSPCTVQTRYWQQWRRGRHQRRCERQ